MDLKQVIYTIESGEIFSLRVITANIKKGTGGEVLEIPKCRLARKVNFKDWAPKTDTQKNANHSFHFTRNIEMLPSKRIITIHPILVTRINKEAVV